MRNFLGGPGGLPAKLLLVAVAAMIMGASGTLAKIYVGTSGAPEPIALGVQAGAATIGEEVDGYASKIGTKPSHVLFFRNWRHEFNEEDEMDEAARRGVMPIVTWQPMVLGLGDDQPEYAPREISAGKHDAYIRRWARDAKAWGKPFYLRPMHEMNGAWTPWGAGVNGNTPAEFVQAWRHIHRIFEREGATNVRWVWSPHAGGHELTDFYPGDTYVDWVALDGYNWGTSGPKHSWRSMNEVFGTSYDKLIKMTNKPMMIAETASTEKGGNKAAWIEQSLLKDIPRRFPRVKAITWFNKDKETDWRLNSSPESLAAYKKAADDNLYQGKLR